jgi:hypothetical protein
MAAFEVTTEGRALSIAYATSSCSGVQECQAGSDAKEMESPSSLFLLPTSYGTWSLDTIVARNACSSLIILIIVFIMVLIS